MVAHVATNAFDVGDMFNHFHRQHDIKALVRGDQFFRRRRTVVDRDVPIFGMRTGDVDIFVRRIGTNYFCAKSCKRFGQDATAASDIQNA